jgi:hypothetical protein
MAKTAKDNQVADQDEDTNNDAEEVTIIEVVTNSEYESMNASKDDAPTKSNPIEEPPPPVRDQISKCQVMTGQSISC